VRGCPKGKVRRPAAAAMALGLLCLLLGAALASEEAPGLAAPQDPAAGAPASKDPPAGVPAAADTLADTMLRSALSVGEQLVYSVRYGLVKAGTATLEVKGLQRINGRVSYQILSTAVSNAVFDKIYQVRDRVMSLMDAEHLYSQYFEKHLREGKYKADQSIRFDQAKGVAVYQNGQECSIEPGCYDVLAAFYRVRTMPLKVGQEFFLTSHADRKNYPLRVSVLRREEMDTPWGRLPCFVIEPRLKSGAFFKNEGRLTIWLTDDDRRLPVLMRSKITVGSISVVLIDFTRPGPAGHGADGKP
jgi:hypothetical protein